MNRVADIGPREAAQVLQRIGPARGRLIGDNAARMAGQDRIRCVSNQRLQALGLSFQKMY